MINAKDLFNAEVSEVLFAVVVSREELENMGWEFGEPNYPYVTIKIEGSPEQYSTYWIPTNNEYHTLGDLIDTGDDEQTLIDVVDVLSQYPNPATIYATGMTIDESVDSKDCYTNTFTGFTTQKPNL